MGDSLAGKRTTVSESSRHAVRVLVELSWLTRLRRHIDGNVLGSINSLISMYLLERRYSRAAVILIYRP